MFSWNLPNILTLGRVIAIPVFVVVFYLPYDNVRIFAGALFIVAAITDWFDGYLARRWNQSSPFGAFLDPVADKLMVVTVLIVLVQADPSWWVLFPVLIITGREIAISALREWMAELGKRAAVAVGPIGKIKTATQMTAISMMVIEHSVLGLPIYLIGLVLLYVAAVLTLWSMIVYLRAAAATF